ncbi:pseudouridine synthase [Pseudarthrobacter cellobiosi]|uniref:pseudouridine synthase n=1 Tax=Pseudarthrobacter cellobiosi TaxID=2953654 RepID=UPI00208ECB54|nr:pseudouridine synthase [Pseudarthrobacter sp. HLT1-5]MCO4256651.1 pseudouridine synthase [Pseudarthrobacter sp. HLT1-5]
MTQAGRQGSPRNSSGRNSSERNAGQGGASRNSAQGGASRNPAQGSSGRPSAAGGGFRAGAGKRNAGFGGGDRPYKAPRPREEPFVDPGDVPASPPAGRGASDWKPAASPSARKPAARKPGANKAPGTPGALKPKPRTGRPGAAASRAFGSERFGQNLGPVRKPARKRGPRGDVPQSEMHDADGTRLQKVMAQAGVASRRVCEEMIAEGRVEVDGQVVTELGVRVDPKTAVIHVDGLRIQLDENLVYMVFNKPKGVVSTMEDPDGRPCISDFVRKTHQGERLFHVGRLDVATEGLLLLTNDGELANRLTHPSYEVPKTYLVQVRGPFPQGVGAQLREGVELEDGFASVDSFKLVDSTPGHVLIEVILHSGKNRIVRRLFDAVGFPVLRLVRVKVGPIGLGDQRQGSIRNLGKQEVGHLLASVGL